MQPNPFLASLAVTAAFLAPILTHYLTKSREVEKEVRERKVQTGDPSVRDSLATYIHNNVKTGGWPSSADIDDLYNRFPEPKALKEEIVQLRMRLSCARMWRNAFLAAAAVLLAVTFYPPSEQERPIAERERPIAEPERPVPEAPARGAVEPPARSVEAAPTVASARADAPVPKPGSLDRLRRDSGATSCAIVGADYPEQRCHSAGADQVSATRRVNEFPEMWLLAYQTEGQRDEADPLPRVLASSSAGTLCADRTDIAGTWTRGARTGRWVRYKDRSTGRLVGRIWLQEDTDLGVVILSGRWDGSLGGSWTKAMDILGDLGYSTRVDGRKSGHGCD